MYTVIFTYPLGSPFIVSIETDSYIEKGNATYSADNADGGEAIALFRYELGRTRDDRGHLVTPDFLDPRALNNALQKNPQFEGIEKEVTQDLAPEDYPPVPEHCVD